MLAKLEAQKVPTGGQPIRQSKPVVPKQPGYTGDIRNVVEQIEDISRAIQNPEYPPTREVGGPRFSRFNI